MTTTATFAGTTITVDEEFVTISIKWWAPGGKSTKRIPLDAVTSVDITRIALGPETLTIGVGAEQTTVKYKPRCHDEFEAVSLAILRGMGGHDRRRPL